MRQRTLFRLTQLGLLFLFCPLILLPQDQPQWGDWKSAPNFPGIKVRVLCSDTGLESIGRASWNFQFQNTYSKQVYLVYQFETVDSTGAPPRFGAPGGRNLDPGEKSAAYSTSLPGSCQSRKEMFIRIVSISDTQGNQIRARAGASGSGAFAKAPRSSSTARNSSGEAPTASNRAPATNEPRPEVRTTDTGCDPNWSPKFNQITIDGFDSSKESVRQITEQQIAKYGGVDQSITEVESERQSYEDQLVQQQNDGNAAGVNQLQQLILFSDGMLDILRCRQRISTQNP